MPMHAAKPIPYHTIPHHTKPIPYHTILYPSEPPRMPLDQYADPFLPVIIHILTHVHVSLPSPNPRKQRNTASTALAFSRPMISERNKPDPTSNQSNVTGQREEKTSKDFESDRGCICVLPILYMISAKTVSAKADSERPVCCPEWLMPTLHEL